MRTADVAILIAYNFWADGEILSACERVSPEDFTRPKSQTPIALPKLAAPAQRALAAAGVTRLAQLSAFTEAEVKAWHGIGPNALKALRQAMRAKGLSFASEK